MINIEHKPQKYTKVLGNIDDSMLLTTIWVISRELSVDNYKSALLEVEKICRQYQLYYDKNDNYNLHINGQYIKFKEIFKFTISNYQYKGEIYHAPSSNPIVPQSLVNKLVNIIGFNINGLAQPNFKQGSYVNRNSCFYPSQVAKIYKFPDMSFLDYNQVIGIIELGDIDNNIINNLHNYLQTFEIEKVPPINITYVDKVKDSSNSNNTENLFLFTQMFIISSIARNAQINVYYGSNTEYGFYDAINKAIIDKCNIITISWSSSELNWPTINMESFNELFKYAATKNITITSATQNTVDFPSSSPHITSCGGTTLCKKNILCDYCESAWNSGRCNYRSTIFKKPNYQNSVTYDTGNMRIVPDIAGTADTATGYIVYSAKTGGYTIIGGTGVVVALWASLVSLVNQYCGYNIGFLNEVLYKEKYNIIKDIVNGKNGKYSATVGWDPCCGIGSPIGLKLSDYYNSAKPKTNFVGNPVTGYAPLVVSFSDLTSGYHNHWTWDFGNNKTSNLINPINVYNSVGKYTVSLVTSNVNGQNIKKKIQYINVIPRPLKPIAKFSGYPVIGLVQLTVKFQNTSTGKPTKVMWDFGDGSRSEQYSPTHMYNFAGTYSVKLYVYNVSGCDTVIKENYIKVISDRNNDISANLPCCK